MDDKDQEDNLVVPKCLMNVQIPLWTIRTAIVSMHFTKPSVKGSDSSMDDKDGYNAISVFTRVMSSDSSMDDKDGPHF